MHSRGGVARLDCSVASAILPGGMTPRFRLLAALLVLIAFGSAGGERLWVSVMAHDGTVSCTGLAAESCTHGAPGSKGPTAPCPSMPAGVSSTCSAMAIALPVRAPVERLLPAALGVPAGATARSPVLRLAHRLFRPPRV